MPSVPTTPRHPYADFMASTTRYHFTADAFHGAYTYAMVAVVAGRAWLGHRVLCVANLDQPSTANRVRGTESVIVGLLWTDVGDAWGVYVLFPRSRRVLVYCRPEDQMLFTEAFIWNRINQLVQFGFHEVKAWEYEHILDISDIDVGPAAILLLQKIVYYYAKHVEELLEVEDAAEVALGLAVSSPASAAAAMTAGLSTMTLAEPSQRTVDLLVADMPTGAAPPEWIAITRRRLVNMFLNNGTFLNNLQTQAGVFIDEKLSERRCREHMA